MGCNKKVICSTGEVVYNYHDYLLTRHWTKKRIEVAIHYGYECQFCHEKNPIKFEIHHKTYKRLGKEIMSDLLFLCGKCHRDYHKRKTELKNKKAKANPLKPIKIKKLPKITKRKPILYVCPTCSIELIIDGNCAKCLRCRKKWTVNLENKENPVFTGKSLRLNPIVIKRSQ